jgi:hypothetical protein
MTLLLAVGISIARILGRALRSATNVRIDSFLANDTRVGCGVTQDGLDAS